MKGSAFLSILTALADKGTWDVAQGFRDEDVESLDWEKSVAFELDDFEMESETQTTALISQDVIDHFRDEGIELYSVARDMAMFDPPGVLGVGILDWEKSVVFELDEMDSETQALFEVSTPSPSPSHLRPSPSNYQPP
ncbi:hypothetical protein THAOC_03785, partial [Thalassiosira oceanica]